MEAEPTNSVQGMLFVGGEERSHGHSIPRLQYERLLVVATAGNTQPGHKVSLPSWVDFLQDG